jgi:hypothetical protein
MVERKFNRPLVKIHGNALCWLTEAASPCMLCGKRRTSWNEPMTLGVEVFQKATVLEFDKERKAMTKPLSENLDVRTFRRYKPTGLVCARFICVDCAEKTFEDILARIKLLKAHGKEGYRLFDEIK